MDYCSFTELFGLSGKTAVITGAGGVLYGSISKAMAAQEMKIALLDVRKEAAQAVADEINKAGGTAIAVQVDVLDKESVQASCDEVLKAFGSVDVLINGAGGNMKEATTSDDMEFFDLPADAIRWVFDLNCIGTILPCQVYGKVMAKQGNGVILNTSSMNYYCPLTRVPAYSAAKAAISNFTQWLAVHMSQNYSKTMRVNAIAPGFFLTEQNRFLLTDKETGDLTQRGQSIIDHTPMARFGTPEELIGAVLWLISPASEFVHGTTVAIDGGFSAFSGV